MGAQGSTDLIAGVLEKPEIYAQIFKDIAEKFGFAAGITLVVLVFLMWLITRLVTWTIETHKDAIRELNEQNKRYQDYFLKERRSSQKKYLGEKKDDDA